MSKRSSDDGSRLWPPAGVLQHLARVLVALALVGCRDVWIDRIAEKTARDLSKIQQYEGLIEEHWPELPAGTRVVKSVRFAAPWNMRSEVLEPPEHRGELWVYSGQELVLWSPQTLVGHRIRGLPTPTEAAVFRHIRRRVAGNLEAYAFSLRGERSLAGQPANEWRVIPTRKAALRLDHAVWTHRDYALPLGMQFFDPQGSEWYAFRFTALEFSRPSPTHAFDFDFPPAAVVFEWDLNDPGLTSQNVHDHVGARYRFPQWLPQGFSRERSKIVASQSLIPMVATLLKQDAGFVLIVQSPPTAFLPPLAKPISLGTSTVYLTFAGEFSSLSWLTPDCRLDITSNIAFPDLVRLAESMN